jgi:hypothetical protein
MAPKKRKASELQAPEEEPWYEAETDWHVEYNGVQKDGMFKTSEGSTAVLSMNEQ